MSRRSDAVVVPAISAGSSVTAIRSLGRRGVRTIAAVDDDDGSPATRSRYCDEVVRVPPPHEDLSGYAEALLTLARRGNVRTIVPVREPDVYVLARRRAAFADAVGTPWPPHGTVEHVQDRHRLVETAADAGVPVPETRLLDERDTWNDTAVVKSRYAILATDGRASYPGVEFVDSGTEPDVEALVDRMGHVPIVQEYVPGDGEYGFFALYDEGEPIATFCHRRIRSYKYVGGASVFRVATDEPALRRAGRTLLDRLDWHGPAMVEFKRDERDGSFRLMEINPRFWGSLALPVHAGVDFPYLYYRLANGDVDAAVDGYDRVGCHRLTGEGSYLHSLFSADYGHVERPNPAREALDVAASLVRQPNFDYLAIDDPAPFVADVASLARDLLPSDLSVPDR